MKDYLVGVLNQQKAKIDQLFMNILRHGRITASIEMLARERLSELRQKIDALKSDILSCPLVYPVFLRAYNIVKEEIDHIEAILITTLNRWNDTDEKLNILADKMTAEISFPILSPVVVCSSQRYYYTFPKSYIIFIPLTEGQFLLHFPDLFHELGHSLIAFSDDKRLEPFQKKYLACVSTSRKYVLKEIDKEECNRGPNSYKIYLMTWFDSWPQWIEELFCDLFAVATLGPAFVWSHLHLCISVGTNPYTIPLFTKTSHPPDAARMDAMLLLLESLGFSEETDKIKNKWKDFIALKKTTPSPEYRRCFPDWLLKEIADSSFYGVNGLNCSIAHPSMEGACRNLLNQAWKIFWETPMGYAQWEKEAVKRLMPASN